MLLFGSEILAPTQTRTDFPTRSAACTVSANAKRTIVDYRVAVVVESGRDVVRQRRSRLEDYGSCEPHRQTFTNKARDQVTEVCGRRTTIRTHVEVVGRKTERAVGLVCSLHQHVVDVPEQTLNKLRGSNADHEPVS